MCGPATSRNAITGCGLDRVAGKGRPQAGCACAGLISASTPATQSTQRAPDVTNSEEARNGARGRVAPPTDDVVRGGSARRFVGAELYPSIDAVDREPRGRGAPGTGRALNTAGSALCAFLSTVVAKARGVGTHCCVKPLSPIPSRPPRRPRPHVLRGAAFI